MPSFLHPSTNTVIAWDTLEGVAHVSRFGDTFSVPMPAILELVAAIKRDQERLALDQLNTLGILGIHRGYPQSNAAIGAPAPGQSPLVFPPAEIRLP